MMNLGKRNLKKIKEGLGYRSSVSEHCGNYPMTTVDEEYDEDEDPCSQLFEAAYSAEQIIDVLIDNPKLAKEVANAMILKSNTDK